MKLDFITLFPEMLQGVFGSSIIRRAVEAGILRIDYTQLRDFAFDKFKQVDDTPFGGGSGMVLKPEPMFRAVRKVLANSRDIPSVNRRILLMSPDGVPFTQEKAKELAKYEQIIFLCGHYEGFDARIVTELVDEAVSIGDYVLTGGELPAMVIADAVARMLPGVLGAMDSAPTDSFYDGLLGFPQYTRPRSFEGLDVPEVLISGDHAKIARWRRKESIKNTLLHRPDLLEQKELAEEDQKLLDEIEKEIHL
ncbi:tRNA (guanosine(37)-N1)-methyltransferase TrmD [Selenomonas sp. TAMA-11512]|uniref:tRNA (guanosine(37)-N1)-methyltransferase TrmD n=1 Tax=Selenomonas sp. TAMA-11512 TaxID=3095337 RepID=UPI003085444C|nr:tRNA (guanosine(37)-N1)-methyltransferase TrmD [Selenomonas sp. TAMA-11512]